MLAYLDTSALAKWYLNESRSDEFSAWIHDQNDTHISSLTALELRCLLARRKRMGDIAAELEQQIFAVFKSDVETGHLIQHSIMDAHVTDAINLLQRVSPIALRTLDAAHLQVAMSLNTKIIATADRIMAAAADELGMQVADFSR